MKIAGKGSVFKVTIAGSLTAISQVIGISLPSQKHETVETDTLDNPDAAIPEDPTGRVKMGEVDVELYFDPVSHAFATTWLNETTLANIKKACAVAIGSTPRATWSFDVAGIDLGGKIVLNDYLKGNIKGQLGSKITVS